MEYRQGTHVEQVGEQETFRRPIVQQELIIADNMGLFGDRLIRHWQNHYPEFSLKALRVRSANDLDQISSSQPIACLSSPEFVHAVMDRFPADNTAHFCLIESQEDNETVPEGCKPLSRWLGASKLLKAIKSASALELTHMPSPLPFHDDVMEQSSSLPTGLVLVFGFDSTIRQSWINAHIHDLLKRGRETWYLPIMPLYEAHVIKNQSRGPSLAELLLVLEQEPDIDIRTLGQYVQHERDSLFSFRLPQRSDDLITCSSESLRRLIDSLRRQLESEAAERTILIECSGLPLTVITKLAVLCTCFVSDIPSRDRRCDEIARQELGILLAALPRTCTVWEMEGSFPPSYTSRQTRNKHGSHNSTSII